MTEQDTKNRTFWINVLISQLEGIHQFVKSDKPNRKKHRADYDLWMDGKRSYEVMAYDEHREMLAELTGVCLRAIDRVVRPAYKDPDKYLAGSELDAIRSYRKRFCGKN